MITQQKIEVRQAPSTEAISSVLTEVVTWLSEVSEPQWSFEVVSPDVLNSCYLPEEMFIGYLDGEPVSCIVLQARDTIFWPDDGPMEALYVHKLAVVKKARGSGIADQLMAWARDRVKREGRNYLRLDCRVDRIGLVNYYASKGFDKVAIKLLERGEFQLFQVKV